MNVFSGVKERKIRPLLKACGDFSVTPIEVLHGGHGAAVAKGVDNQGENVVVKTTCGIWWYSEKDVASEVECLTNWGKEVAVEVKATTPTAICLEWLPDAGKPASLLGAEGLAKICSSIAENTRKPKDGTPDISSRMSKTIGWIARRPLTRRHRMLSMDTASRVEKEWTTSSGESVLLHGDLCPDNLSVGEKVKLFDPLGCSGPLPFDVAYVAWRFADTLGAWKAFEIACSAAGMDPDREIRWFEQTAVFYASTATPNIEAMGVCGWHELMNEFIERGIVGKEE